MRGKCRKTGIIAVTVGVALIIALAAACSSQSSGDGGDAQSPPPPPTQSPVSPNTTPDDSPPPTSPDTATSPSAGGYTRTVTLGGFTIVNDDLPDNQKGWCSDNDSGLPSSGSVSDFTSAQYLIVEFDKAPAGGIYFVWVGDSDGAKWNQTDQVVPDLGTSETTLVINLSKINGYDDYVKCTGFVKIFLGYHSSSWNDLGITDAYLAVDG
jgi:hypothetical protein